MDPRLTEDIIYRWGKSIGVDAQCVKMRGTGLLTTFTLRVPLSQVALVPASRWEVKYQGMDLSFTLCERTETKDDKNAAARGNSATTEQQRNKPSGGEQDKQVAKPIESGAKRMRADQSNKTDSEDPSTPVAPGCFIEAGDSEEGSSVIVQATRAIARSGTNIVQGTLKLEDASQQSLEHEGCIERGIDTRSGSSHWVIYHPAAKVIYGLSKGRRWFGDQRNGGCQSAKEAAETKLDEWRHNFAKIRLERKQVTMCLCPWDECPNKDLREHEGQRVSHVSTWRLVHANSVEHQLHSATAGGRNEARRRCQEIERKCKEQESHASEDAKEVSVAAENAISVDGNSD